MSADRVDAVINAPEHELRALVKALLTGNDDLLRRKVLDTYSAILRGGLESSSDGTKKRKSELGGGDFAMATTADDVQSCVRCKTSFSLSRNPGQDCLYHPGWFHPYCLPKPCPRH